MAALVEAQNTILEEVLSHHDLKRQDLDRACPRAVRYEIGVMIVAWRTTKEHFQFKENLAAKEKQSKTEERRIALIKAWDEEVEKESSGVTYFDYMASFYHQRRRDLMDFLCSMVNLSNPVTSGPGLYITCIPKLANNHPFLFTVGMKVADGIQTLQTRNSRIYEQFKSKLRISSRDIAQSLTWLPPELKIMQDTTIQEKLLGVKDASSLEMPISQLFS